MKISIHRNETSQPIVYDNAVNAYTKGGLYCILTGTGNNKIVHKYPLVSIFRIIEEEATI